MIYFDATKIFLDENKLKQPPVKLYRLDSHNVRVYYTPEEEVCEFYPGLTGFLNKVLPTPQELIDWLVQMGKEAAAIYVKERAIYGSLMHGQFAPLLEKREYDLEPIPEIINGYCKQNKIVVNEKAWSQELKSDVLAFAAWMDEYKVVPIAIEIPLRSVKYGIATLLDLVCKMTVSVWGFWGEEYKTGARKGDPKETSQDCEIYAIVDFKSRKKAYVTESDELQLAYCEEIFKENYPEFNDKEFKLYSWHPKDWKTAPGSHFTEHTNKRPIRELELYSELYRLKYDVTKYSRMKFKGVVKVGEDLTENYQKITLAEVVDLDKFKEELTKKKKS